MGSYSIRKLIDETFVKFTTVIGIVVAPACQGLALPAMVVGASRENA